MSIDAHGIIYATNTTEISGKQVANVIQLLVEEDCTIPFITRYRKEKTGGLDEVQIQAVKEAYEEYLEREKRRAFILEAIKKQEKLTKELEQKILACDTINQLEDIYAPFKTKTKSKGQKAIEAGLEPFADFLLSSTLAPEDIAKLEAIKFINKDKKINNLEEVFKGALDIIVERISHNVDVKDKLRKDYEGTAKLKSIKRPKAEEVKDFNKFKDYFEFSQNITDLKNPKNSHRFLAMRRAMTLKILKVDVDYPEEEAIAAIEATYLTNPNLGAYKQIKLAVEKAYKNYIHTSLDLEFKTELKKLSDESAIDVFGINLKNLLLQPYLGPKAVMAIDPGIRTGCKIAVVDNTGKFLLDTVIFPHEPKKDTKNSKIMVEAIIDKFDIKHIAIGNGTFGRETLHFLNEFVEIIKSGKVKATLVNEDGASIYSTSEIARKEFPDKDPTVRGAISIARRFQDPLAELVKIDPKSIGVGQYQHDVNQAKLKKSLTGIVENCVNFVGVDLNTASAPLLSFISGIGPTVAGNVVKFREKSGGFKSRKELTKVARFSPKVFEQAAGFLRIYNGTNPLDSTFIHPERYKVIESWAKENNITIQDLITDKNIINKFKADSKIKEELGKFTHEDVVKSLLSPSQDPRTEFKSTEFRSDTKSITDLKVGSWYPGIVTNITQFGAFVDIGIKENGLVHVSQIADKFVDNPLDELKVGQELKVMVLDVDMDRKRIALTCKTGEQNSYQEKSSQGSKSKPKTNNNAPLRNNAFAGLKNFKI